MRRKFWRLINDIERNIEDALASGFKLFRLLRTERQKQKWIVGIRNEVRRQRNAGTIWKVDRTKFEASTSFVGAKAQHVRVFQNSYPMDSSTIVVEGKTFRRVG